MTMTDDDDVEARLVDLGMNVNDDVPASVELEPVPAQSYLPQLAEWQLICQQAEVLANSDLVPRAYFRKPANVVLATLAGRPHGWDAAMSMRSFHIIEGQPTMKPELMLALVRARGHSIKGLATPDGSEITGTRCDNGDTLTVSFTLDSAVQAGLCQLKNGKPFARSDKDKPLPWEQYPEDMCWARCVSKLCRRLFPDVVLGAGFVPEEFGVSVNDVGDVIDLDSMELPAFAQQHEPKEPDKISADESTALRDRASALPTAAKDELREWAKDRGSHLRFSDFTASQAKVTAAFIATLEKRAEGGEWADGTVEDAVVICDGCGEPESDCGCATPDNGDTPDEPPHGVEVDVMDPATLQLILKLPDDGLVAIGRAELEAACRGAHVTFDAECDDQDLVDLLRGGTAPF